MSDALPIKIGKELPLHSNYNDLDFGVTHRYRRLVIAESFGDLRFRDLHLRCLIVNCYFTYNISQYALFNIKKGNRNSINEFLTNIWKIHKKIHLLTKKELLLKTRLLNEIPMDEYLKELKRRNKLEK